MVKDDLKVDPDDKDDVIVDPNKSTYKKTKKKKKEELVDRSVTKGSIDQVVSNIRKKYGNDCIERASKSPALRIERIPSGIYAIDKLTEGGWPLGRVIQIYGKESGGKTTTLLKSIANAQRYCKHCLKVRPERVLYLGEPECSCAEPGDFETIYLDVEGTYDADWAEKVGVDNNLVWVTRPSYAEEGLDILDGIVNESDANFVIVDTITMLTPKEEREKSAGEVTMALRARLINKALRKLVASQNEMGMFAQRKMTIFLVCHVNVGIGGFRPTEEKAGGKTKEFVNSFELRYKKCKVDPKDVGKIARIECEVKKTKITSTFGDIGVYDLVSKSTKDFVKGTIDETSFLFKDAMDLGIFKKEGKCYINDTRAGFDISSYEYTNNRQVQQYLVENRSDYESLKRFTLDYIFGKVE